MMRPSRRFRHTGLMLIALAALAVPAHLVHGQTAAPARDDIVNKLAGFETGPDLDIAALKQKISDRSKMRGKNEPEPSKRPLIVPELKDLPTFTVGIDFDSDTPVVRPSSYQTVGRIADALVHASLLPYSFLIVGHTDSNGRREANVPLSQRRADAIRDSLVNTFKISSKRVQSLGLGEEQFVDQAHPTSAANQQIQIVTIGKVPETEQPAQPAGTAKPAKKSKKH
jgi:outer membrane protein OmpA-like peptidoglycan-associated protein